MKRMILIFALVYLSVSCGQSIFINQAGYISGQLKIAYFNQQADSFFVVDKGNNQIVFRGSPSLHSAKDPSTGMTIYTGDFSPLTKDGIYQIKTSSMDTSFDFSISQDVFNEVYNKSLKGFYYQRCGTALLAAEAGIYARPACHLNDGVFHSTAGESGSMNTTGGWHDAGDFGKYVVNAGITAGTLLMAYEQFPENFKSDNLDIPESGNSIPDILDEVKYELDWLLKMQDTSDGGVYFKVTPQNFAGFIMPNTDNSIRYIYQKSSTAAADFAAVMSIAARIYIQFDSTFSSICLASAEKAWRYLQDNPSIVPPGGFHNPSGTYTGEYGDGNDSDERLWAAAELYITTGDSIYQKYFLNEYQSVGLIYYAMGWGSVGALAEVEYILSRQPDVNSSAVNNIKTSLINYCNQLYKTSNADGFNSSLKTTDYYWGSNSVALNNAVLLIIGYQLTKNKDYYNTALGQLNYILGSNCNNICYVTGIGEHYPMHIHHRPSASDGIIEPYPGLMAGGPNHNIGNDPVLSSHFTSSTPPALCYIDDQGSYASNEICINWNAPLVFAAGYFSYYKSAEDINDKSGYIPKQIELKQNFPNPFNPSTTIDFVIDKSRKIKIAVYNQLGQQVALITNGNYSAGNHSIDFNASHLTSGIYYYRITAGSYVQTRKMVLLK